DWVAGGPEHPAAEIGGQAAVLVVKPDQDETAALDELPDGLKSQIRVAGVVQHAIAHHKIETFLREYRGEQIHLQELGSFDFVFTAKIFAKLQGAKAPLRAG